MTFFAGHTGSLRLRRNTTAVSFTSAIRPNDVNTLLNRIGFDGSFENLVTGDRVSISTVDKTPLSCFPAAAWPLLNAVQDNITAYVNVNLAGGLRFFRTFNDAINNDRADEIAVASFAGSNLKIEVTVEDLDFNIVGDVQGFTFQTEREAIDTTTLSDKFRAQYAAGLISGSGSIDALFKPFEEPDVESSLLLVQLINRLEVGGNFQAQLFLTEHDVFGSDDDVYYDIDAVVTRAGVEVGSDRIISASIDFVATGPIKLRVGLLPDKIVMQNGNGIAISPYTIGDLLQSAVD